MRTLWFRCAFQNRMLHNFEHFLLICGPSQFLLWRSVCSGCLLTVFILLLLSWGSSLYTLALSSLSDFWDANICFLLHRLFLVWRKLLHCVNIFWFFFYGPVCYIFTFTLLVVGVKAPNHPEIEFQESITHSFFGCNFGKLFRWFVLGLLFQISAQRACGLLVELLINWAEWLNDRVRGCGSLKTLSCPRSPGHALSDAGRLGACKACSLTPILSSRPRSWFLVEATVWQDG